MSTGNTKLGFVGKLKDFAFLNSYVTIENNKCVTVESCKQICECNEVMAKVLTNDYIVEVWGGELEISNYNENCVAINGKIEAVKLISRSFREKSEHNKK